MTVKENQQRQAIKTIIFCLICSEFNHTISYYSPLQQGQKKTLSAGVCIVMTTYLALPQEYLSGKFAYIWRTIYGLSVFYLILLTGMVFQTRDEVMKNINIFIDPSLNFTSYQEMSYAEDCTLIDFSSPNAIGNIWNALFDLFTFGNFIGWFSKAIILRDFKVLVFASLAFEGLEFALRNIINNFRECWWDHLILDFSMFNFLVIAVGYQVLTYFNCERYNWCGFSQSSTTSFWTKFKTFWSNTDLSNFQVGFLSSTKRYLQVALFILIIFINDLTIFFIKYIYQIPPHNFLNFVRVTIVGLLSARAVIEYYDWLQGRKGKMICTYLKLAILALEVMVIAKHSQPLSRGYVDTYGKLMFASFAMILLVLLVKVGISDLYVKNKEKIRQKITEVVATCAAECHKMILYQIYSTFTLHHQITLLIILIINPASQSAFKIIDSYHFERVCLHRKLAIYLSFTMIMHLYLIFIYSQLHIFMLFKIFEHETKDSPLSTQESLPLQDPELGPEDKFRLAVTNTSLNAQRSPQEVYNSVLEWFTLRGIVRGHPEELKVENSGMQMRKVISSQENAGKVMPGLLERRLNRKLTFKL